MNTPVILDASAVLAYLQGEPGWEIVDEHLRSDAACCVTAANQAEVIAKALDRGVEEDDLRAILADLDYKVVGITDEDGDAAGWMRDATRPAGLSLGDRLCLAVAQRLKARVVTADRPWLTMASALQLDIRCIRPDSGQ